MATVFDSQFGSAGFSALLTQFGECLTYLPNGDAARPIKGIVERNPPSIFDAAGNVVIPTAIIRVKNSTRSGISSQEIDTGLDEIKFVKTIGETTQTTHSIGQVISQGSGVLRFTVI